MRGVLLGTKDTPDIRCVLCHDRRVGIVGKQRYFCSECCIEFTVGEKGTTVYLTNADGIVIRKRIRHRCVIRANAELPL